MLASASSAIKPQFNAQDNHDESSSLSLTFCVVQLQCEPLFNSLYYCSAEAVDILDRWFKQPFNTPVTGCNLKATGNITTLSFPSLRQRWQLLLHPKPKHKRKNWIIHKTGNRTNKTSVDCTHCSSRTQDCDGRAHLWASRGVQLSGHTAQMCQVWKNINWELRDCVCLRMSKWVRERREREPYLQ